MRVLAFPLLLGTGVFLAMAASGRMRLVFLALVGVLAMAWVAAIVHGRNRPSGGRAPFQSLGFVGALALAWLACGGFGTSLPFFARILLGALAFALALVVLGPGHRSVGFRAPLAHGDGARLRRRSARGLAAAGAGVFGGIVLLLADPLPRAARVVLDAGAGLRDLASPLVEAVTGFFGENESAADGEMTMRGSGAERNFGETRDLPVRADIRQGDELELFVRMPDPADFARVAAGSPYVRATVMNRFTGGGWQLAGGDERVVADADDGRRDGFVTLGPGGAGAIRHEVFVKGSSAGALPALQGLVSVAFDNVLVRADGWYVAGVQGDVRFGAVSVPAVLEAIPPGEPLRAGAAAPAFLEVPPELRPGLRRVLAAAAPDGRSLRARLDALVAYCAANFVYSLKVENPDGLPPLENFLFHERRGYCDLFASAGVLLCREMGIPARIAFGHAGGEAFPGEGILSFSSRHGHSWTEIFLQDHGWVLYDLTPKAAARAAPQAGEPSRLPAGDGFGDARLRDEPVAETAPIASWLERIPARAVYAVLALLILVWSLVRVGARVFGKSGPEEDGRRRRVRRDRDSGYRGSGFAYPDYFLDFRGMCRALGVRDDEGQTLRDLLRTLRGAGLDAARFEEMTAYHYATRYEEAPRDPHREKQFRRQIRQYWKEGTDEG